MKKRTEEFLIKIVWVLFFLMLVACVGLLISRPAHAGGSPQLVIFNPPVGAQIACVITSFQYLNGVLRLGTDSCISDRIFTNGFED